MKTVITMALCTHDNWLRDEVRVNSSSTFIGLFYAGEVRFFLGRRAISPREVSHSTRCLPKLCLVLYIPKIKVRNLLPHQYWFSHGFCKPNIKSGLSYNKQNKTKPKRNKTQPNELNSTRHCSPNLNTPEKTESPKSISIKNPKIVSLDWSYREENVRGFVEYLRSIDRRKRLSSSGWSGHGNSEEVLVWWWNCSSHVQIWQKSVPKVLPLCYCYKKEGELLFVICFEINFYKLWCCLKSILIRCIVVCYMVKKCGSLRMIITSSSGLMRHW